MHLSDIAIKALPAPRQGAIIHYDDALPGFGVRVSTAGTKSFVLTHGSRRTRETIGRVGIVTLKAARDEAKRRLAQYTLGKHHLRSIAWNTALKTYLADVKQRRRQSTHDEYKRILEKYFRFGDVRMSEVSPYDLQKDLDRLSGSECFHAYTALRPFIRWAYRRHYIETNPLERMTIPKGSTPRQRVLTDAELRSVWNACDDDNFGRIVKLLILTGQRTGEISRLTCEMVRGDKLVLPAWLCKNGREHTIPIATLSRSLLKPTERFALLFPARTFRNSKTSRNAPTAFNGWSKSKAALDTRSGVTNWTLHDLRRTFASGLASQGVALHIIEKLLNHVSGSFGGIVGVYQRYNFFPEMKSAIETWERHVQTLVVA